MNPRRAIATLAMLLATAALAQFDGSIGSLADEMRLRERERSIEAEAREAFDAGDHLRAAGLYGSQIKLRPSSFVAHYNLACALAHAGETDLAIKALERAVELGFSSYATLTADPDLTPLRTDPRYRVLVDRWPAILDAGRQATRERASAWIDRKPNVTALEDLRLDVLSAFDEATTERATEMLERVAAWAESELFPDLRDPEASDRDPWVTLVLPDERDFHRWVLWSFGREAFRGGATNVGGAYEHDDKRLIAKDTGATLRHEALHVFHWRDMERRGQNHPIWIHEGLASLVEDMDPAADGPNDTWRPVPSWRTNIARHLAERRRLTPIQKLATFDQRTFTTRRPLRQYAEARTLLLFLLEHDALARWYRIYTTDPEHGYAEDPSGITAMTSALGMPLERLETVYRDWAASELPEVPESLGDLGITLGLDLRADDNGAPRIQDLSLQARRESDLRMGDVITALNGRPIDELQEFVRVLAGTNAGETITLAYRRGTTHGTTSLPVRAHDP